MKKLTSDFSSLLSFLAMFRSSKGWQKKIQMTAASGAAQDDSALMRKRLYLFTDIAEGHFASHPQLLDKVRINVTTENRIRLVYDRPPTRRVRGLVRWALNRSISDFEKAVEKPDPLD